MKCFIKDCKDPAPNEMNFTIECSSGQKFILTIHACDKKTHKAAIDIMSNMLGDKFIRLIHERGIEFMFDLFQMTDEQLTDGLE